MASRYNEMKDSAFEEYRILYKKVGMSLEHIVIFYENDMRPSEEDRQADNFLITLYFTIAYLENHENIDFMKERIRSLYKTEYMAYYKEKVVEEFLTDVEQIKKYLCID